MQVSNRVISTRAQVDNARLVGDVVFVVIFASTAYVALSYPPLARTFPLWVGVFATVLSLINLGIDVSRRVAGGAASKPESAKPHLVQAIDSEIEKIEELEEIDPESSKAGTLAVAKAWGWVFGFALVCWLAGFEAGTALFIFTILRIEARKSSLFAGIGAAAAMGGVMAFSKFLDVPLPEPAWWPF